LSRFFSSYAGWKFFDLWLGGVREGRRIVSVAAMIAVAANTDGRREIAGPGIGP
jgi:hypothetical protein